MRTSSTTKPGEPEAGTALGRESERGNVAVGYLFIAAIGIAVATALIGLGAALLQSDQRAKAVLTSNSP